MDSKQPIQLLHEVEIKATSLMNEIWYIQKQHDPTNIYNHKDDKWDAVETFKWHKALESMEKERKDARQNNNKKIADDLERAKKEKVIEGLKKR